MRELIIGSLLSLIIYSVIFRAIFRRKSVFLAVIATIIMVIVSVEMYSSMMQIGFNFVIILISMAIGFYSKKIK